MHLLSLMYLRKYQNKYDCTEAAILRTATVGSDVTLPCNSTFLNPVRFTAHL